MDHLEKLRVFVLLAQLQNEREAARVLHMTQPSVSATVRRLEDMWSAALLVSRGRRGIALTDAGRLVYDYSVKVLELTAQTRKAVMQVQQGHRGLVTVSLNPRAVFLLPGVLHQFQQEHPHVVVEIKSCLSHEVPSDVRQGVSDLGVTWEPVSKKDFRVDTLGWEPFEFFVGKGHPLAAAAKNPLALDVVARYQITVDLLHSSTSQFLKSLLAARGIEDYKFAEVGTYMAVKEVVMAGMGVGFGGGSTIHRETLDGLIIRLTIKDIAPQRQLVMISRPGDDDDVAVATLRSHVLHRLAGKLPSGQIDLLCTTPTRGAG